MTLEMVLIAIVSGLLGALITNEISSRRRKWVPPKAQPRQEYKLVATNKFGNFDQFTDENGLQEYKNGIVINHMTGEEISEIQIKNLDKIIHNMKMEEWRSPTTKELLTLINTK